jgi:hypothetical protein
MEADSKASYQPPVDKLLTYGESDWMTPDAWPDYRELGIGPEHIPDLIRMATDEELNEADAESREVWAPMHAWRALGQLRAVEAVEPLLGLFDRLEYDDWVGEELPDVFGMIGPAALPALAENIADLSHTDSSRISAITSIENIGKRWPDARGESIALLEERLKRFEENEPDVNGFLVLALVKLGAREAAPIIERAFDEDYVDPIVMGDWDDVQVELGLKSAEEVAQKRASEEEKRRLPSTAAEGTFLPVFSKAAHKERAAHKKAKNKMAKQSRKKNRKR